MNNRQIESACKFLYRADLKGNEVEEFMGVITALCALADANAAKVEAMPKSVRDSIGSA